MGLQNIAAAYEQVRRAAIAPSAHETAPDDAKRVAILRPAQDGIREEIYPDLETAEAAIRRNLALKDEQRVSVGSELLLEDEEPEAPPRTGPRKGLERKEYDAKRHNWKTQVMNRVIDENLHAAVRALARDDAGAFTDAMTAAINDRVRDAVADRKLKMAMGLVGAEQDEREEN